jgi:hypothetical protein
MNEILSDEEPFDYSSESYQGSEISSTTSSDSPTRKKKKTDSIVHTTEVCLPSTSRETVEETIEDVIRNLHWSDSSTDDIIHAVNLDDLTWTESTNLKSFVFDSDSGISKKIIQEMSTKNPVDFFHLFVTEELLNEMVIETNRYADQKGKITQLPKARIKNWKNTNINEMKFFLGLQIWIGLVQMPKLSNYWSNNVLYSNEITKLISRNRFELLLSNWHFANNEANDMSTRLYKIKPLIDHIRKQFQLAIMPSNNICIDESLVPFRGRLSFLQYIKNKRHKFGIKFFKLCIEDGYTYDFKIYCGKEKVNSKYSVPTSVVMGLCENLLDHGRTIYVDNYYTSVELAHKLLDRQTHLVGTLRKNRKGIPKDISNTKLKKGEIIGKESNTGITIIKWCDKREVLMLSTKHTNEMVPIRTRHEKEIRKPAAVIDYNKSKSFIDLSDQIKAYSSCLRKSIKWYRKMAIEILLGSAMVNAFIIYKKVTGKIIQITKFREQVAKDLLQITNQERNPSCGNEKHILEEVGSSNRGRCVT